MLDNSTDTPVDAIARIKQLQEEIARLSIAAKDEALSRAVAAVEALNALGLPYRLVEDGKKRRVHNKRRQVKIAECQICGFITDPPHDARKHRSQGEDRRPFTSDELGELGLQRTDENRE